MGTTILQFVLINLSWSVFGHMWEVYDRPKSKLVYSNHKQNNKNVVNDMIITKNI